MKTTEYLYGCNALEWANEPYKMALLIRIDKAKELLGKVIQDFTDALANGNRSKEELSMLAQREKDIMDAIKFNEKLLAELSD